MLKIDIENKILIPFMILIILSIFIISGLSYYNGYQMLLSNEIEYSLNDLNEMVFFLEKSHSSFILLVCSYPQGSVGKGQKPETC
jgi:hypothetical protein